MRQAVLETLDICIRIYWMAYYFWLIFALLIHGIDRKEGRIRQRTAANQRLLKGFFAGIVLTGDFFILSRLPSEAILALGKNSNISPYIFFGLLLVAAELLLITYITKNIDFSEFSFGGLKLTRKDDRIMINYYDRQELRNTRLKSKLLSSSLVFHNIMDKANQMCQAIMDSPDIVEEYIRQFEDLMHYYIGEQRDCEQALSIRIFCKNEHIRDAISKGCNLSGIKAGEEITRLEGESYHIIEEDQRTLILIQFESEFAGVYIIVASSKETEVILMEEIYILNSIFSAFDQFIYELLLTGVD